MERKLLSSEAIGSSLENLDGWHAEDGLLKRRFRFADFAAALAFVNQVGTEAERMDHHPDITFGWGYAEVATTTHDRGGITDMDTALAEAVDRLATAI